MHAAISAAVRASSESWPIRPATSACRLAGGALAFALTKVVDKLRQEERVPVGNGQQRRRPRNRGSRVTLSVNSCRLVERQGSQRQALRAGSGTCLASQPMERMRPRRFVVAIRHDDHYGHAGNSAQRKRSNAIEADCAQCISSSTSSSGRGWASAGDAAEQRLEQSMRSLSASMCGTSRQRGHARAHLGKQLRDAGEPYAGLQRRNKRQRGAQCVDDALVWGRLRRAGRTDEDSAAAFFDGVRELENHARLADAGLSADENAGAAAASDPAPGLEQLLHLRVATDERQDRRTTRQSTRRGGSKRCIWLTSLAARDRLAQRERFGHRLDVELQTKQLREAFVLGERSGAVAGFAANRHDLAYDVFTPRIERKDLLRSGNSPDEIALPARLRNELHQRPQEKRCGAARARGRPIRHRARSTSLRDRVSTASSIRCGSAMSRSNSSTSSHKCKSWRKRTLSPSTMQRFARRVRRQNASQVEETHAQLGSRGFFLVVRPHDVREEIARNGSVAIEQQIRENGKRLTGRREPKRLPFTSTATWPNSRIRISGSGPEWGGSLRQRNVGPFDTLRVWREVPCL